MKTCPVCNDSFADALNFCDLDGARLTREGSAQERNKWWSLLGAGLLVGALVISAGSILFLPKARVSPPLVNSEPPPNPVPPAPQAETIASAAAPSASAEPESDSSDVAVPEVKKKDKVLANSNVAEAAPNPKAAALAAEGVGNGSASGETNKNAAPPPKQPEAPPAVKSASENHATDAARPTQPSADAKKDQKTSPAVAKSTGKDSNDKKKNDKEKKGGFLRVFKKIFGKD